jgi:hypothetical protein
VGDGLLRRGRCPVQRSWSSPCGRRWPVRPPFGVGIATLVGLAPSWGFGSSGTRSSACASLLVLGFWPPSSPSRRRLPRPMERYVRSFPDLEVFPVHAVRCRTIRSTAPPLQGCVPFRECSPCRVAGRPRDRLSSGLGPSDGSGPCGIASAATPRHRRLQGFGPSWRLRLRIEPPRCVSPGSVRGVLPSGLVPVPDRGRLSASAGPRAVSRAHHERLARRGFRACLRSGASPGADCHVGAGYEALLGVPPLQGFQATGLSARADASAGFATGGSTRWPLPLEATQPADPPRPRTGEVEVGPHEVRSPRRRSSRFGSRPGLAMCSPGAPGCVAAARTSRSPVVLDPEGLSTFPRRQSFR